MRPVSQYISLITHMGAGWMLYRAGYSARRKLGILRRASPAVPWEKVPVPGLSLNLQPKPTVPDSWGRACVDEAETILKGEFCLFSHRNVEAGFPPDWHRNYLTAENGGQTSDVRLRSSDAHWSEISDFGGGDIKGIWELSRFPWAFALTRAYARTGDARYAEGFWRLFVDWCGKNPPNTGPNWMCGQEATFRLLAVVVATEGLGVPRAHRDLLAKFVVATGRRIDANLDYSLSQKNNHGVSECVGLITAALGAPALPESAVWFSRGLRELEGQADELVYADGGFSQHSLVYHRVLLHDLVWVATRLERSGHPVPDWLLAAGRRATEFLLQLADPVTGQGPLYGPNDGANILPLAEGAFLDLRPVLQLSSAVFRRNLPFVAGPWDEAVAWLVKDWENLPRNKEFPASSWHAPQAGCWQMSDEKGRIFLRCPTGYRHRPSQADMLHVDIWHNGQPVAMDGGSYSYNSRERFTALGAAAQHNVMIVDGIEPITKFSRFLYLPWPKGEASAGADGFCASYDGYASLGIKWTRTVDRREAGGWLVRDHIRGAAGRMLHWHWRLADRAWVLGDDFVEVADKNAAYRVSWSGAGLVTASLTRADPATSRGWWAPYYAEVEPACALVIQVQADNDIELRTVFSPVG